LKCVVLIMYGLTLMMLVRVHSCYGAGLPDTIDRLKASVVGVGTVKPAKRLHAKGPAVIFAGTGFIVGDGRHVVTNNHVIAREMDTDQKETLAVFVGRGRQSQVRPATIVQTDPEHDLALLKIEGDPMPVIDLGESDRIREGEEIAFTGFPIGVVLGLYPVTHTGIISAITPIVIPANSSSTLSAEQVRRMRNPITVYQLDATAYPGNSGSPVYEVETGSVIGVINSVFVKETRETLLQKPSGITYAIPVTHVHALIQNQGK